MWSFADLSETNHVVVFINNHGGTREYLVIYFRFPVTEISPASILIMIQKMSLWSPSVATYFGWRNRNDKLVWCRKCGMYICCWFHHQTVPLLFYFPHPVLCLSRTSLFLLLPTTTITSSLFSSHSLVIFKLAYPHTYLLIQLL